MDKDAKNRLFSHKERLFDGCASTSFLENRSFLAKVNKVWENLVSGTCLFVKKIDLGSSVPSSKRVRLFLKKS